MNAEQARDRLLAIEADWKAKYPRVFASVAAADGAARALFDRGEIRLSFRVPDSHGIDALTPLGHLYLAEALPALLAEVRRRAAMAPERDPIGTALDDAFAKYDHMARGPNRPVDPRRE